MHERSKNHDNKNAQNCADDVTGTAASLVTVLYARMRASTRTHDANRAQFSIVTCLRFIRDQFLECWPHAVAWKSGYMDENLATALGWRNEAKPAIVIPFCQCAVSSHD